MSLITRCPACLTTFRVVPDQLRISEGWVRCGQCQHVFDANAALVDNALSTPVAPALQPAADLPAPVGTPEPVEVEEPVAQTVLTGVHPEPLEPAPVAVDLDAKGDAGAGVAVDGGVDLDLGIHSDGTARPEAVAHTDAVLEVPPVPEPVLTAGPEAAPEPVPIETNRQDLSFMRRMPLVSSWQRKSLRIAWGVAAIVLLVALGIQGAVQERDRIAAMFPQAKPALQWMCRQLNCTVSSLRQIESVVIDSSSFNKIRPDAYRLGIVLRNTSALDIAMPALELTLTDSQDQPVMRRVLPPTEYASIGTLNAAGDWTGSVAITVRGNGSDRFSGYKVLAFYP